MAHEAYGSRLGRSFQMDDPPTLVSLTANDHRLAVTELRCEEYDYGFTAPIVREEAFLIGLQLRGLSQHELWVDGKSVPVQPIVAGHSSFFDLTRDPIAYIAEPYHPLFFYLTQAALDEVTTELGIRAGALVCRHGQLVADGVIEALGHALLPALHAAKNSNALFVDHALLALRSHLVQNYIGVRQHVAPLIRGLAPWQERTAKEIMREHLADGIALATVATACGLSVCAFINAFKRSTGMSPHQWLIQRRIELAMDLMRNGESPLSDIALAAGFADQSHFTRAFSARLGVTPGIWRRNIDKR
ncbi:helix-turn-helix domain-containing protein [Dyella telluris]|uniref:Helix-turn-helix transcriptional regulator n=1 Tax=Dyella telluris TaxID=2763498 RepID=A0A7G8Q3F8_9GAMM|nr:AraC family transcriptional regulator [Dyella telluris]QNK01316.1 helix-turn-helix transcriptional regulator [Dyella telluris]